MLTIEVIPYSTFKERIRIVKNHLGKGCITVEKGYIYIERIEGAIQ